MIDVENSPLAYFEDYKKKYKAKNYQDDCNDHELKDEVRKDLLCKQRNQCAYCERKIDNENSHIEHIEPRDKAHTLECEYSNMILSCNNNDSCGKYKDSKAWESSYIHPVLHNPTDFFKFSLNGEVLSIDDQQGAVDTIEFLNLNSKKLLRLRKNIAFNIQGMGKIECIGQYFDEFENFVKELTC